MFKSGKTLSVYKMEFPTAEQFEQNKVQLSQILKWREVPTEVIYRIEKVEWINTKIGRAMVVCLVDQDGEQLKAFATSCLIKDLKDYSDGCYIKSIGKQESIKNPGQSYYHYEIMRC